MYLKLMIDEVGSQPFSAVGMAPIERPKISFKEQIIENSRRVYAQPRKVIEENIVAWHEPTKSSASGGAKVKAKEESRPRSEERGPRENGREKDENKQESVSSIREHPSISSSRTSIPAEKEKVSQGSKRNTPPKNQDMPLPPSIGVDEDLKISVERLTHKNKAKLGPSENNRKGLKEVLMGLVKENSSMEKPKPAPNPGIPRQTPTNVSEKIKEKAEPRFESSKNPREVPESVLKKILDID